MFVCLLFCCQVIVVLQKWCCRLWHVYLLISIYFFRLMFLFLESNMNLLISFYLAHGLKIIVVKTTTTINSKLNLVSVRADTICRNSKEDSGEQCSDFLVEKAGEDWVCCPSFTVQLYLTCLFLEITVSSSEVESMDVWTASNLLL